VVFFVLLNLSVKATLTSFNVEMIEQHMQQDFLHVRQPHHLIFLLKNLFKATVLTNYNVERGKQHVMKPGRLPI
jgi:hypothetical protein